MCTAFSHTADDHYFGRNLDLDHHYDEKITITPREYLFQFRHSESTGNGYAMIGIATIMDDYPLYYEAINESGLCMAGLNFPKNAAYAPIDPQKTNIASFELIPWILRRCKTVQQAKEQLNAINLCNAAFREDLSPTPLHWIISDRHASITVEPAKDGLQIIDNPMGILTNNPPFSYHTHNIVNYFNLTSKQPTNRFSNTLEIVPYSLGMGAIGLPGDFSSASRFVRCSFLKENAIWGKGEQAHITQAFHILDGVSQFDGCVETELGYEKTLYSICCNASKGILYYITYYNRQISAIDMNKEDLSGNKLLTFPLLTTQNVQWQN